MPGNTSENPQVERTTVPSGNLLSLVNSTSQSVTDFDNGGPYETQQPVTAMDLSTCNYAVPSTMSYKDDAWETQPLEFSKMSHTSQVIDLTSSSDDASMEHDNDIEHHHFLSKAGRKRRKIDADKSVMPRTGCGASATLASRSPCPLFTESADTLIKSESNNQGTNSSDTVISGRGMWNSWTRNFTKPLLALFDLLDNAIDATSLKAKGRIEIKADREVMTRSKHTRISGLAIYNSSLEPIKPLRKVLEIYSSQKGACATSIGENGVGLKQGCATLSNLSFCLSSNRLTDGSNVFSLGVLALALQTEGKCSLPSIQFKSTNTHDLKIEMLSVFRDECPEIGECVHLYGSSEHAEKSKMGYDGPLKAGIERLVQHFDFMTSEEKGWGEYHVFGLVLHRLKHGPTNKHAAEVVDDRRLQKIQVRKLLKQVYDDLPSRYLHVPSHLDVLVGGKKVNFNYWQCRLVEMAQFDLDINKDVLLKDDPFWKTPSRGTMDQQSSYCKVRLYIGFDALRVNNEKASKTASLYYYSREVGRLIRKNDDARSELGLANGGTVYCQGLTILLDDVSASLPLNPTKEQLAFSEQVHGDRHKANLIAWVNAATRFYYNYFVVYRFSKLKKDISKALTEMVIDVNVSISRSGTSKSLRKCEFTNFGKFVKSVHNPQIRLVTSKSVDFVRGNDTLLHFTLPAISATSGKRKAPPAELLQCPIDGTLRVAAAVASYADNSVMDRCCGEGVMVPRKVLRGYLPQNEHQGPSVREAELLRQVQLLEAKLTDEKERYQSKVIQEAIIHERSQDKLRKEISDLLRKERALEEQQEVIKKLDAKIHSLEQERQNHLEHSLANKKQLLLLQHTIAAVRLENEDLKSEANRLDQKVRNKEQLILSQKTMIELLNGGGDNPDMMEEGEDQIQWGHSAFV